MSAHTFRRILKSMVACRGDHVAAHSYAAAQGWTDAPVIQRSIDTITAGNGRLRDPAASFIESVGRLTVLGRLSLRPADFHTGGSNIKVGASASFVAEGAPAPATGLQFEDTAGLPRRKCVAFIVATDEAAGTEVGERRLEHDLTRAVAEEIDRVFLDDEAGDDARPASILHNATTINATGNDGDALCSDLLAALRAYKGSWRDLAILAHPHQLAALALSSDVVGPVIAMFTGGSLAGAPIIASEALADSGSPETSSIVLLDQSGVELATDAEIELRVSRQGLIQGETTDSPPEPISISLWQENAVAIGAARFLNWRVRRPGAVVRIAGANYLFGG